MQTYTIYAIRNQKIVNHTYIVNDLEELLQLLKRIDAWPPGKIVIATHGDEVTVLQKQIEGNYESMVIGT
jgi:hypothetical protein